MEQKDDTVSSSSRDNDSRDNHSADSRDVFISGPGLVEDKEHTKDNPQTCRGRCWASRGVWGKVLLVLLPIVLLGVLGGTVFRAPLEEFIVWLQGKGAVGGVVFGLVFVICTLVCFPSTLFEISAGFAFPLGWAFAISFISKTLGSVLSFLFAKRMGRAWVEEKLLRSNVLILKGICLGLREQPVKMVLLIRLSWLPIAVKNYGMGVLPVTLFQFMLAMIFVASPYTVMFVLVGNAITQSKTFFGGETTTEQQTVQTVGLIVGVTALLIMALALGYFGRRAMNNVIVQSQLKQRIGSERRVSPEPKSAQRFTSSERRVSPEI